VSNNAFREKSFVNYSSRRMISVLFMTLIALVSSTYIFPLVYSQEFYPIIKWGKYGIEDSTFKAPKGIAVDSSSGNVYVADTANNRIQVFSSNGTFLSEWGRYGTGNGTLNYPEGIAVDSSSGNVYVADTANNRIQVFSSNGTFLSGWGRYGGIAGNGTLRSPAGIAVDSSSGNVYVADTAHNRIQVFSSNGTFITKWGTLGQVDINFRSPAGIAVDSSSGNVYVADTANNRISVFTSRSHISNVAFSSEDGEIYGNDTNIMIEPIYDGLKYATAIAFLGANDMLVLQKENNTIMRVVNGQMLDEPVLDLGNTTTIKGCVCDIAILQNDNGTSYAFLYYYLAEVTEEDGTTKLVNSLYRYDISNGRFINPNLVFEMPSSPAGIHHGGKLMIGPDNNIYLTIGDIDGRKTKAQNMKNGSLPDGSSSILRFTPEGEPVDGGLLGATHPLDKYYAYGLRNSFGMDYDPINGNIWITDNGPEYGDEINIVRPGFNGGWNRITGSSSFVKGFNITDLELFNGSAKYYDPVFEWRISIGVTDLVFVPSDTLGEKYKGNLFVGDVNSGYLYRFHLNQNRTGLSLNGSLSDGVADNNIEKVETVFAKINSGGINDLEIGPDGLLYVVSAHKIMRLVPAPLILPDS
jgi:aldose sugar dehydrogenase